MKIQFLILIVIFVASWQVKAQNNYAQIVASAGEFFSDQKNSISYTIGDIVIESRFDSNVILTQGFQQSSYVLTKIEEVIHEGFEITIFPNPVKDALNIHITSNKPSVFNYLLFDLNGNVIKSGDFNLKNHKIEMGAFSKGIYILKVSSDSQKVLKTYKLQKF